jgi:signal peptidase I
MKILSAFFNGIKRLFKWIAMLLALLLVSWLIQSFLFSAYVVPSGSMIPTIQQNDYVFTVKSLYRWHSPEFYPLSNIPFPFYSSDGMVTITQNDVVVFHSPISHTLHPSKRMRFVKRVAGLPGDTLYVYTNGSVHNGTWLYEPNRENGFKKSRTINLKPNEVKETIYVPGKGFTITLTENNRERWETAVKRDMNLFEKEDREFSTDTISTYTFQQDHYFMIGDNMPVASDSRKWGCVPGNLILGKVLFRYRPNPFNRPAFAFIRE